MTKDNGILILGLIVAITPFLGIPQGWKTIIFVLSGLLISFLAFLIKRDTEMHENKSKSASLLRTGDGIVTPGNTSRNEEKVTEEKQ